MDFYVGDRVVSLIDDRPGLQKGEFGSVVGVTDGGSVYIKWDKYNKNRHNGRGDIPIGHGWFIDKKFLTRVSTLDLGELPENNDIKFLFGDDIYDKNM